MGEISKIDKKILYELITNSRQTYKSIGKKINQSKNVVYYRMKKLENMGIIKNYFTIIDIYQLGYIGLRMYTNLQYMNPKIHEKIIDHFSKDKNVGVVYTLQGEYELDVIFWIKQYNQFFSSWQKTLKLFSNHFQSPLLSFLHQIIFYDPCYLLDEKTRINRRTIEVGHFEKIAEIDEIERKILQYIASNARKSTTTIAKELNLTEEIVRYRIKKMMQQGIIKGFSTTIDFTKIGYEWNAVNIDLRDYNEMKNIVQYLQKNPHFIGLDMSSGYSHFQIEFHVLDSQHLRSIVTDLLKTFPDSIRRYSYMKPTKVYKRQYFPEK